MRWKKKRTHEYLMRGRHGRHVIQGREALWGTLKNMRLSWGWYVGSIYSYKLRLSHWPRLLRLKCATASSNPPGVLMSLSDECCVMLVEFSVMDVSLEQSSPAEHVVSQCDCVAWVLMRPWSSRGCRAIKKIRIT